MPTAPPCPVCSGHVEPGHFGTPRLCNDCSQAGLTLDDVCGGALLYVKGRPGIPYSWLRVRLDALAEELDISPGGELFVSDVVAQVLVESVVAEHVRVRQESDRRAKEEAARLAAAQWT